jgi:GT2 family glycosyltransferase
MDDGDRGQPAREDRTLALRGPDVVVRSDRALGVAGGRPIVVVLGMHRSGTSLLSNVLHLLGADMADTTDQTSPKNAGGFWERPELVAIHDEILIAIDRPIGRASHVLPFPPAWWRRKEVQALKPKLIDYVERQLAKSSNLWGFKDPRTSRLLPLWWEVLRELDLRPLYVHALRAPAEASVSMSKKSAVRRLSVSSGELMWLTYNYDIVRYVTAEHPTVMVDYDEWFDDGPAVAQRLADALGIGDDLTSDDLVECVHSVVRGEYRHEKAGKSAGPSEIPLATMLYKAMTASNPLSSADARGLRGQLKLVDLFLKSLAPIASELDEVSLEQRRLLEDQRQASDERAAADQALAERGHEQRRQLDEAEALARQAAEREAAAQQRIAALENEQKVTLDRLEAARAALDDVKTRAAMFAEAAERERGEHAAVAATIAALEDEAQRAAERLATETARGHRVDAELAQVRGEVERAQADAETSRAAIRRGVSRTRNLLAVAKAERAQGAALRVLLDRQERTARADIEDRDRQLAALADAHAEELAELAKAHEEELAELRDLPGPIAADDQAASFVWPMGASAIEVDGKVTRVDDRGIGGEVRFADRHDIVPIVEVRVGSRLIVAQACTAGWGDGGAAQPGSWRFAIPWSQIADDQAGQRATVRIAGIEHELGTARIPKDLKPYHLPPAAVAAQALGGTVAEAEDYHRWIALHEPVSDADLARTARVVGEQAPITVIVYGGKSAAVTATVHSLIDQTYAQWEALCVGAPKTLAALDSRVRIVAAADLEKRLAEYADDALVTFVEANDRLAPTALAHLAAAAKAAPGFALIYSDEDGIEPRTGARGRPYMKGEWSIDLALAQDYVSRLALLRKSRLAVGSGIDSGHIYGLALRAALSGEGPVVHVPFVLYHRAAEHVAREVDAASVVADVLHDGPEALAAAKVARLPNGQWRVEWPLPDPAPRVSLIVPTRDRIDLLRVCVEGFLNDTNYDDLEILIADNESVEDDAVAFLAKVASHPRVKVIPAPGPFNYSAINNLAARHATGALIGLMNNDLKVIEPDWLRRMVSHALRPDVGIVGAKLLHGDDTIQHAGVTLGIGLASHLYKSLPRDAEGHNGRLMLPQDLSAVTAACLLMRREVWEEVGGLDEEFPIAYNDVDLCLKVREAGYRVVWTPDVLVYHLESQSRGKDVTPEKRARLEADKARLVERWGEQLSRDAFHSPNLSSRHSDARLAFPSRATPPWRDSTRPSSPDRPAR